MQGKDAAKELIANEADSISEKVTEEQIAIVPSSQVVSKTTKDDAGTTTSERYLKLLSMQHQLQMIQLQQKNASVAFPQSTDGASGMHKQHDGSSPGLIQFLRTQQTHGTIPFRHPLLQSPPGQNVAQQSNGWSFQQQLQTEQSSQPISNSNNPSTTQVQRDTAEDTALAEAPLESNVKVPQTQDANGTVPQAQSDSTAQSNALPETDIDSQTVMQTELAAEIPLPKYPSRMSFSSILNESTSPRFVLHSNNTPRVEQASQEQLQSVYHSLPSGGPSPTDLLMAHVQQSRVNQLTNRMNYPSTARNPSATSQPSVLSAASTRKNSTNTQGMSAAMVSQVVTQAMKSTNSMSPASQQSDMMWSYHHQMQEAEILRRAAMEKELLARRAEEEATRAAAAAAVAARALQEARQARREAIDMAANAARYTSAIHLSQNQQQSLHYPVHPQLTSANFHHHQQQLQLQQAALHHHFQMMQRQQQMSQNSARNENHPTPGSNGH